MISKILKWLDSKACEHGKHSWKGKPNLEKGTEYPIYYGITMEALGRAIWIQEFTCTRCGTIKKEKVCLRDEAELQKSVADILGNYLN